MAMSLNDSCLALVAKAAALDSKFIAPSYPKASEFTPFTVTYPDKGDIDSEQIPATRGLHTIITEIHLSVADLALAIQYAIPFCESFPKAVLQDPLLGGACETVVGPVSYEFGYLPWGGKSDAHVGIRFRTKVKIRQTS